CQCTGHTCPAGVSCQLFYKDGDVDGFGDKTGSIMNGKALVGCVGDTPPSGFVANNGDCDDGDAQAPPGQTAFLGFTSAGVHTFDYKCDGDPNGPEKETPEILGGSCGFCAGFNPCNKNATCSTAGNSSAFTCGFARIGTVFCLCCNLVTQAFTTTVACG